MTEIDLKGIVKAKYPDLKGRDWVNQLSAEDKAVFMHVLQAKSGYGTLGGRARVTNGKRDSKGRFA